MGDLKMISQIAFGTITANVILPINAKLANTNAVHILKVSMTMKPTDKP